MVLELKQRRQYGTTLDRAGLALGVGGGLGGLFAVALALAGGMRSPLQLAALLVGTSALAAMIVVASAGPVWLACHLLRRRGPWAAAAVGALIGFTLFLGGQTYGFELYDMPIIDDRTMMFRWLSGMATSAVLALVTAGIGLAMWRVAYRRLG